MFENTLAAISEIELIHLHVFPYSEREGTPAAKMPSIAMDVRKNRALKLRNAGEKILSDYRYTQIGTTTEVLIEKGNRGLNPQFVPVRLNDTFNLGELVKVQIIGQADGELMGKRI
jgi:threonylcarbamoyladenosine tRNA methylthiotransferase MtaB